MGKKITKKEVGGAIAPKDYANQWVMIAQRESLLSSDESRNSTSKYPEIIKLRHPRTNNPASYLFSADNSKVQELLVFDEGYRSWFIGDTVQQDGRLFVCTPVDPLFLILPYFLKQHSKQLQPIDELLEDEKFPETNRLLQVQNFFSLLNHIADQKGDASLQVFKYNEEKALDWLKSKAEILSEKLKEQKINESEGAISVNYVQSSNPQKKKESNYNESYLYYAHGIISDYLTSELSATLFKHLGLVEQTNDENSAKRKNTTGKETPAKRSKVTPTEDYLNIEHGENKMKKPVGSSKTAKALAKSASGSKSIMSFFKKS